MDERLFLFDIDGTLIHSKGAGIVAMQRAAGRALNTDVDAASVDYAGRLDPLIMADMLSAAGHDPTPESLAAFRTAYAAELTALFDAGKAVARALPGVHDVLETVFASPSAAVGLLTGNFEETGSLKLRAAGIDPARFHVRVWGDESPHAVPARDHLPEIGLARWSALTGRAMAGDRVIVIGDTPHDVACAKAHGCRSLAVATGRFSESELASAGADRTVADLTDVVSVTDWLLSV